MNVEWSALRRAFGAAAWGALGVAALAVVTVAPQAHAAPATDDRGFVDSTARCAAPNRAVAYGYTASSRVAICKDDASGQYQYRGVRVSDGAKLIIAARSTDRGYVADNDGITYTVTANALLITVAGKDVRDEPFIEFHGQGAGTGPTSTAPTQPSAAPETVTPATPLPPPLPAEVGGGR